jgi:hypothetical protein
MTKDKRVLTSKDMQEIEAMAVLGMKVDDIARIKGMSREALIDAAEEVVKRGRAKGRARVMEAAFKMALSGKVPAVTLSWLKTQCGWQEDMHKDADERPGIIVTFQSPKPKFTYDQWKMASEEELLEYLTNGTIPAILEELN